VGSDVCFEGVFGCGNPPFFSFFLYEKGDLVRHLAILK